MSESPEYGALGRRFAVRLPTCLFVALPVVLAVVSWAWAGERGNAAADGPDQPVASQQRGSLDEDGDAVSGVPEAQSSQGDMEQGSGANVATQQAVRVPAAKRTVRRGRVPGLETPLEDRSTPWYRSAIGSIAVVLALVGVAYFLVRRFVPAARASESRLLRVVARAALSPKHSVALVHLGRRFVMVGVSPDRLVALCDIQDPDEVAELVVRTGGAMRRDNNDFDEVLVREADHFREHTAEAEESASATGPGGSRTIAAREPLTDLLNRLRTLQSK